MDVSKYRLTYKQERELNSLWTEVNNYLQKFIPKESRILYLEEKYFFLLNNLIAKEKHLLVNTDFFKEYFPKDVVVSIQSSLSKFDKFKDNFFDTVFLMNTLEFCEKKELDELVNEVKRVLKADGKLIVLQLNYKYAMKTYFNNIKRNLALTDKSLGDFLESKNFNLILKKPRFIPDFLSSGFLRSRLLIRFYLLSPVRPFANQMLFIAENKKSEIKDYLES